MRSLDLGVLDHLGPVNLHGDVVTVPRALPVVPSVPEGVLSVSLALTVVPGLLGAVLPVFLPPATRAAYCHVQNEMKL